MENISPRPYSCVFVAHGVFPALAHPGVTKRAFSKLSLREKYDVARYDNLEWFNRVTVYLGCVGTRDDNSLLSVVSYTSKFDWKDYVVDAVDSIPISGSLATLVALRQYYNRSLPIGFIASGVDIVARYPSNVANSERAKIVVDKSSLDLSSLTTEIKNVDSPYFESDGHVQVSSASRLVPLSWFYRDMFDAWVQIPSFLKPSEAVKAFDKFYQVCDSVYPDPEVVRHLDQPSKSCPDVAHYIAMDKDVILDAHASLSGANICIEEGICSCDFVCDAKIFCVSCRYRNDFCNCLEVDGHMLKAGRVIEKVDTFIDDVRKSDVLGKSAALLDNVESKFSAAVKFIENFFRKELPNLFTQVADLGILIADAIRAIIEESLYGLFSVLARIAIKMDIPAVAVRAFQKWFYSSEKNMSVSHKKLTDTVNFSQDGIPMEGHGLEAPLTLSTIVGLFVLKRMPGIGDLRSVSTLCRTFNTVVPTLKTLTGAFEDLPNWLPGCVRAWISYLCPSILWRQYVKTGYRSFSDRCDALMTPANEARLRYDVMIQEQLKLLREEARAYFDDMIKIEKTCPLLNTHFINLMQKLEKWNTSMLESKGKLAFRKCPFVIALYGPPNTGKSTFSTVIAQLLKPLEYPDENLIYSKSGVDEFWSGYTGQPFVFLDDFLATTEDVGLAEMMTAVSNVPLLLNMACVDNPTIGNKGTAFTSDCIVYTTNIPFPKIISLRCEKAFNRRRDILVKLTVKPEYCLGNGMPNYDIIPADVKERSDYLVWQLHDPLDANETSFLGPPMCTRDFFRLLLVEYAKHRSTQNDVMYALKYNSTAASLRAEFPELVPQMTRHSIVVEGHMGKNHCDSHSVRDWSCDECEDACTKQRAVQNISGHCPSHAIRDLSCNSCELYYAHVLYQKSVDQSLCPIHAKAYDHMHCATCYTILKKIREQSEDPQSIYHDAPDSFVTRTGDLLSEYYSKLSSFASERIRNESGVWSDIMTQLKITKHTFFQAHPYLGKLLAVVGVACAVGGVVFMITRRFRTQLWQWKWEREAKKVWPKSFEKNVILCDACNDENYCEKHQLESDIYSAKEDALLTKYSELGWIPTESHVAGYNHETARRSRKQFAQPKKAVKMDAHYSYTPVALHEVDVQGRTIVESCVTPSLVSIWNRNGGCSGFMIAGRYMLTIRHMFTDDNGLWVPEGTPFDVQIGENGVRYTQRWNSSRLIELPKLGDRIRDAIIYQLDSRIPSSPNRLKHFMKREEIGFIEGESGCVVSLADGKIREYCFPNFIIETRNNFKYNIRGKEYCLPNALAYASLTQFGDCGAPTVVLNKALTRRICGIHVCGHSSLRISASEYVFFEDLDEVLPKETIVDAHAGLPNNCEIGEDVLQLPGFTFIGNMPSKYCIPMASKTDIVPSPLTNGKFPYPTGCFGKVITAPAVLTPFDSRLVDPPVGYSPLLKGLKKYSVMSGVFDETLLDIVYEHLKIEWGFPTKPPYPLTTHEVLNGVSGKSYFDPINWNTSPGYPYKLLPKIKTKADLTSLCDDGTRILNNSLLEQRYANRLVLAHEGKRIDSLWIPCCKDERRPLEKVFAGSTRVFSNGSFDFVLFSRYLTAFFNADFYASYHTTSSAVGMDCESEDWNEMISYLYSNSSEGFAGDFSRFDGTLSPQCVERFGDLMDFYYGGENRIARKVLIDEIIHPIYLAMGSVLQAHGGNPSGNPQTVVVNSIVNAAYLRYVWMLLAPSHLRSMAAFDTNVRFKVYGDDNIVSVKQGVQSWFNMTTVSASFASLGIEFLDSQKRAGADPIVDLDSVTFLKRRNVMCADILNCRYFGLMDHNTIIEMIHWIRRCDDPVKAVQDNVNMALLFAFFGGRKYFTYITGVVNDYCRKNKIPILSLYHYQELLIQWRTGKHVVNHWIEMDPHSMPVAPISLATTSSAGEGGPAGVGGDASAVITSDRGVTFADQQAPILQKIADGVHSAIQTRAQRTMPDISWQVTDMVEKVAPVGNYNWTTAQAPLTEIVSFQLPFDAVTTNTISIPFENFTFWRGDMLFQFKINGNAFQIGRICVFYVPLLTPAQTRKWHLANKAAMTSGLHVFLDPSTNEPVNLLIPFTNINNHINTKARNSHYDFTGTLMVAVFNQLNASTGVSGTAGISVHVSFPKANFHLPQIKAFTTRLTPRTIENVLEELEEIVEKKDRRLNEKHRVFPQMTDSEITRILALADSIRNGTDGTSTSSEIEFLEVDGHGSSHSTTTENHNTYVTANTGGGGTGVIPDACRNVTPIEIHADNIGDQGASTKAESTISPTTDVDATIPAPMDKPSFGLNAPPALKRGVGMMSHAANIEWLQRLTLYQSSLNLSDAEHFGTGRDEMSFDYLFRKLTFFDYQHSNSLQRPAVWSASDAINTVILSGYIGPCQQLVTMGLITNTTSFIDLLGFATLKNSHWRGAIRFRFDVVCNSFQSGRLAFAAFYGETSVPATFSAKTCQYVFYMDVSAKNHQFVVELPYYFQRPWQRVPHGPVGGDPSAFFLGTWAIFVVTPLVHSDNTPSSVEINCFKGGGDNYRIMNAYANNKGIIPMLGHSAMKTGSVTLPTEVLQQKDADLSTKPPPEIGTHHFGEQLRSVRDLLKRYYPVGTFPSLSTTPSSSYPSSSLVTVNYPEILGIFPINAFWNTGLAAWYGSMYRGVRGSVRLKIMVDLERRIVINYRDGTSNTTHINTDARTVAFYDPSNVWWETPETAGANVYSRQRATLAYMFGIGSTSSSVTIADDYFGLNEANIGLTQLYKSVNAVPLNSNISDIIGVPPGALSTMNSFPMDISDRYAPIHEIEIPFVTQYEILYNQVEETGDMFADNNLYCHGSVILGKLTNSNLDMPYVMSDGSTVSAAENDVFHVFAALGDDFHFGIFLGPHRIVLAFANTPTLSNFPFIGETYPNT